VSAGISDLSFRTAAVEARRQLAASNRTLALRQSFSGFEAIIGSFVRHSAENRRTLALRAVFAAYGAPDNIADLFIGSFRASAEHIRSCFHIVSHLLKYLRRKAKPVRTDILPL